MESRNGIKLGSFLKKRVFRELIIMGKIRRRKRLFLRAKFWAAFNRMRRPSDTFHRSIKAGIFGNGATNAVDRNFTRYCSVAEFCRDN